MLGLSESSKQKQLHNAVRNLSMDLYEERM